MDRAWTVHGSSTDRVWIVHGSCIETAMHEALRVHAGLYPAPQSRAQALSLRPFSMHEWRVNSVET